MIGDIYQGKGYGFESIMSVIEEAKSKEIEKVSINHKIENIEMKRLLNKLNFKEIGYDVENDEIMYELRFKKMSE